MRTRTSFPFLAAAGAVLLLMLTGVSPAAAGNRYVDASATGANNGSSWADAFTTLQSALTAATDGDTIHVAQGTYKPTTGTDRMAFFKLDDGRTLLGGYPNGGGTRDPAVNETILSGDIGAAGSSDNSYHVVESHGAPLLDGFTITAGNANRPSDDPDDPAKWSNYRRGSGMFCDHGNVTVTHVTFSGNSADDSGGGMFVFADSPTLTDVTFSGNSARFGGGMSIGDTSSPTLTQVTFSGNSASYRGGGMSGGGSPTLTDVTFSGNTADYDGGGMSGGGNPTLTNVTFSGNSAGRGGGMYADYGSPTLTNVTFSGNSAGIGGGLMLDDKPFATLTHVTFSGNTASFSGGGLHNQSATAYVRNTILWGNTPNQLDHATISDSVVQGGYDGYGGTNIITADPKLGTLGNYGGYTQTIPIQAGSSAIDAANPAYAPNTDQRGVARPQLLGYDIGAYELELGPDVTPPELTPPPDVTVEQTNADGTPVDLGTPVVIDLGDLNPLVSSDAPAVFPLGETPVTWTATDFSGNVSIAIQIVTVLDTTPPTLDLPMDTIEVEQTSLDGAVVEFAVTAADICDVAPQLTSDPPSASVFALGTKTVTVTATDASGNVSTGTFTVKVVDTTPPVLTVPIDVTAQKTDEAGTPVDIGEATATDTCDADVAITNDAPALFPLGETVVTWTATDDSGNVSTATQKVTVTEQEEDTTPPELTVPADVTAEQTSAAGTAVAIGEATATDNVDADVTITNDAPAVFPLGETVVTWTATDDAGNVATATQKVTVVDTTEPELTLPADATAEQTSAAGTAVEIGAATATDLCDADVAITNDAPAVFPLGETVVTWTATDDAGNVATATQKVTVVNSTKPSLSVKVDAETVGDGEEASSEQSTGAGHLFAIEASASDVCDAEVALTVKIDDGQPQTPAAWPMLVELQLGEHTLVVSATDDSGNVVTTPVTLKVTDTQSPTITVPGNITAEQTNRDGTPVNLGTPVVNDVCDVNPTVTNDAPAVFPLGTTTVTWTAKDASGNVVTATQNVTIVDTTAPGVSSVTASPNQLWPPNHQMVDVTVTVGAADACDAAPTAQILSVTSNEPINGLGDGDTAPDWVITGNLTVKLRSERSGKGAGRIYTITVACTDASGNRSTRTVAVTVPKNQGGK